MAASIPEPAGEGSDERFQPVQTVDGECRHVPVEAMLAKERAGVPELEMRRLGLLECRRGGVEGPAFAAEAPRQVHRGGRGVRQLGGVDRITPQTA